MSANTNFQVHGRNADASNVTQGSRVRVTGVTTTEGEQIEGYKVNVIEPKPPKSKSPGSDT